MTMTEQSEQPQDEPVVLDGPDPRTWFGDHPIGRVAEDIEAILRVQALRKRGNVFGNAHDAAGQLLDQMLEQAQAGLSLALLTAFGAEVPKHDGEPAFPFAGAGRPRAFGMAEPREDIVSGPLDRGKPA
jgi:hypothetical protein